jgi:hypothetical protein
VETFEGRVVPSIYVVNSLTDTGAGSGLAGDLRYCITKATSGSDTITFASGLTGTITLQSLLPTMKASVAITGPGASKLTVVGPGGSDSEMFNVGSAATLQISGLTLANAFYVAIYGNGSVVVSNITFTGDGIIDSGYAIATYGSATVSNSIFSANNGGIYNTQTLDVSNCTFSGNYNTAIITEGSATVSDSTFSGNGAAIADGGNLTNLTVNSCTLSNNGSGVSNYHGTLTVNNCSISDNSGGIYNNGGSATINNSTISGNLSGGIANTGNLTISNSTISGNKSIGAAAGYATGGPSGSTTHLVPAGNGAGGGIYMGGGTLSINSSTIADNEAEGGSSAALNVPGLAGNGYGGGLYIAGGTVTINNSTLAGNLAGGGGGNYPGSGYGGGIDNAVGAGALQMYDTILANNTADAANGPDLYGSVTSQGHNLFGNTAGGSGFVASDLVNVNPQLGPLQNNGGPDETMALLAGSSAINAGDNTGAPAYDQRGPGFPRIVGGTIDIGAFEVQNSVRLVVSGFPSPTIAGTPGSFTVTVQNTDGTTDTSYTGTVSFTSSDAQAALPASYTFTAGDAGTHIFSATLFTAGTQSITATDTTTAGLSGKDSGITVDPAAASRLVVSGFPSPTTAGASHTFTVTAEDPYGNVATGFAGTVHFTSSDAKAVLPANYTFTAADAGTHTFSATLKTAGTQSITARDTATANLSGTDGGITVKPAAARKFLLRAPSGVTHGVAFSVTLRVEDAYGNVVTGYTGTVHFSSTDSTALLPANYTFTAGDAGVHTFTGLVLHKKGKQKISVTDTLNSSLTATDTINVG